MLQKIVPQTFNTKHNKEMLGVRGLRIVLSNMESTLTSKVSKRA